MMGETLKNLIVTYDYNLLRCETSSRKPKYKRSGRNVMIPILKTLRSRLRADLNFSKV